MNRKRYIFLVLLVVASALLAFVLIGPARNYVIIPLMKAFWLARGFYGTFPQAEYWIGLVVVVAFMLVFVLLGADWGERRSAQPGSSQVGDVQQLSYWIVRSRKGIYSRWHLARRLADLALEILEAQGGSPRSIRHLQGPGWHPSPIVQRYLEAALRTSYADFARKSASEPESSLDANVNEVVDYLESLLEIENDHTRS